MRGIVAWIVLCLVGGPFAASLRAAGGDPVPKALEEGKYPWYDAKADAARPLWPPKEPDFSWFERWFGGLKGWKIPGIGSIGDLFVIGMVLLALTILTVFLLELWRRYRPIPGSEETAARLGGLQARIEGLPEGLRPETNDPWAEALARRDRGDYAGAIICLFAHQLLALDRLHQLRLAPGLTGRQLVRSVDDRDYRGWVEPTLRLFEAVYYGGQVPARPAFEAVWAHAEAFERRIAQEARS